MLPLSARLLAAPALARDSFVQTGRPWTTLARRPLSWAVLAGLLAACGQPAAGHPATGDPPTGTDSWAAIKAEAVAHLRTAPGWGAPRPIPGEVNSPGWEDSADLSGDGQVLHIAYIAADFHSWVTRDGGDPGRFSAWRRGPDRDNSPAFSIDTLVSRRGPDGRFEAPRTDPVSRDTDPSWQAETGYTRADGVAYYTANHPCLPDDHDPDIWADGARLPFNTVHDENDPSVRGDELFFWSGTRPGGPGRKDIWVVHHKDSEWGVPQVLPSPINHADSDSWQPFLDATDRLWFTSNRDGPLAIWVSRRTVDGRFGPPTKLLWPAPGSVLIGVAEPTLTEDGKTLCFCTLFQDAQGGFDLDVALVERL